MKKLLRIHLSIFFLLITGLSYSFSALAQPGNDGCASSTLLTSSPTCTNTAGTLKNNTTNVGATATAGISAFCGNASSPDVWYRFVAKSTFPTIGLSSMGTNMDNAPRLQLFNTASCTVATLNANSNTCVSGTNTATLNLTPTTALTIGTTYLVRVFTNGTNVTATPSSTWNFNICVTDPAPANNLCGAPVVLTSSTSCVNTAGNMYGSTLTAPTTINAPNCGSAATYDIWYRFVAQTTNPTITLSSVGGSFAGVAGMQLLSNNCGGTFTSYFCGTTSIAANFLTPGNTYFIRVFGTGALPTTPTGYDFNICVTDPVTTPPSNDNCTGAVNLSVNYACNPGNNPGNMAGATSSAPALGGLCTGPLAYDVWYKFTAISTATVVDLSSIGTNFLNPGIEVFSGTCGSLTSIACGNDPLTVPGLTAGTTYYIRIYSRTVPPPNGNARFSICLTSASTPVVRFGNSYVNISKKTTGGVVEPGDTLEIRMTMQHSLASTTMSNLRFVDNIPANTAMLTGINDSIKVITNEGLTYKRYTRAAGDDAATYLASPPVGQYNIRMNLGFGTSNPGIPANNTSTESASATGTMVSTNYPRGGGSLLFATAYRVVATGAVGDTITLNSARFIYNDGVSDVTLTATSYKILISDPLDLCANSFGINNATEFGGTFGSGTTLNRTTDLTAPIAGYSFVNDVNAYNALGDGRYAIVKNISPRSGTNRNANRVTACGVLAYDSPLNCNNRMFGGHWYIDGDHTSTNDAIGNVPPDATTNSGYMLMVNADYVASEVFSQTLNNLCPNTYYEFSAWFRNICPTCGVDSLGRQFTAPPTAPPGGYPGVYPNLSFALNGLDYYSTGEIDTVGWLKKGFVFRTGPAQTSASFSIRNNSQGGGGNDWVLDDIAVATCLPTMQYSPSINPMICEGASLAIYDTVRSYFDNYTYYRWQRSTDGGSNWTDITSTQNASLTYNGSTYQFITSYTIPPANTNLADGGDLYRVIVATSTDNLLNSDCLFTDASTIITLTVNDCGIPLKTDLLSFSGKLVNDKGNLLWTTSKEDAPITFTIERSSDGISFISAGSVNSFNNYSAISNSYSFIDPVTVTGKVFYRLLMTDQSGVKKYSSTIQLSRAHNGNLEMINVINPFYNSLKFEIAAQTDSKIEVELLDLFGKVVQKNSYLVHAGINALSLLSTEALPSGTYIFRVKNNEVFINRKVLKKSF